MFRKGAGEGGADVYMCPLTIKNWCGTPQGDLLFEGVAQTLRAHMLQAHRVQESGGDAEQEAATERP